MESFQNRIYMPYKDTRVPVKLIALHEYFGEFTCRLFDERLHLIEVSFLFLVNLYVSVSCFGAVGLDAQCDELVVFGSELQSLQDSLLKLVRFQNQVIRRSHYDGRIRIYLLDDVRRVSDRRCGVAPFLFYNELAFRYLRKHVENDLFIVFISCNIDIAWRNYFLVSVEGLLQ